MLFHLQVVQCSISKLVTKFCVLKAMGIQFIDGGGRVGGESSVACLEDIPAVVLFLLDR